jgi:hypothetical protein
MPAKAGFRGLILTRWSSPRRLSENSFSLRRNRFFSGFPTEREVTTRARARNDEIEKPTVQEACERRLASPTRFQLDRQRDSPRARSHSYSDEAQDRIGLPQCCRFVPRNT